MLLSLPGTYHPVSQSAHTSTIVSHLAWVRARIQWQSFAFFLAWFVQKGSVCFVLATTEWANSFHFCISPIYYLLFSYTDVSLRSTLLYLVIYFKSLWFTLSIRMYALQSAGTNFNTDFSYRIKCVILSHCSIYFMKALRLYKKKWSQWVVCHLQDALDYLQARREPTFNWQSLMTNTNDC